MLMNSNYYYLLKQSYTNSSTYHLRLMSYFWAVHEDRLFPYRRCTPQPLGAIPQQRSFSIWKQWGLWQETSAVHKRYYCTREINSLDACYSSDCWYCGFAPACKNLSQFYRQVKTFQRLNTEKRGLEDTGYTQLYLHLCLSTNTLFPKVRKSPSVSSLSKHGAGSSAISGSTAPTTARQGSCIVIPKTMINNNIRQKKFAQTLLMHHNKTNDEKKCPPSRQLLRSSSRGVVSWAPLMDDEPPAQLFAVPARSISPGQRWKPFSWRDETSLNSSKRPQKIYGNISKQTQRRQLPVDQMWLKSVRPPTAPASLCKCSGGDKPSTPLLLDNWTRVSSGMLRSFQGVYPTEVCIAAKNYLKFI